MASKTAFIKDFRIFLRTINGGWDAKTDVQEFRRWIKDELVSFNEVAAHEQFYEKINYEISIGNDNPSFYRITDYLEHWLELNEEKVPDYVWYYGTTEEKLKEITACGMIKRSTIETYQHTGFEHDIGTVSLAKNRRHAIFFSAIGNQGNQVILFVDIRKLDKEKMKFRELFNNPNGEILYSGDIPFGSVFLVEKL